MWGGARKVVGQERKRDGRSPSVFRYEVERCFVCVYTYIVWLWGAEREPWRTLGHSKRCNALTSLFPSTSQLDDVCYCWTLRLVATREITESSQWSTTSTTNTYLKILFSDFHFKKFLTFFQRIFGYLGCVFNCIFQFFFLIFVEKIEFFF